MSVSARCCAGQIGVENTGVDCTIVPAVLAVPPVGNCSSHKQREDQEDQADDGEASCNGVHVSCPLGVREQSHAVAEPYLRQAFIWRSR